MAGTGQRVPNTDRDVLLAVRQVRNWIAGHRCSQIRLPQDLAGVLIEGAEAAVRVTREQQSATCGHHGHHARTLVVAPQSLAGFRGNRKQGSDVLGPGRDLRPVR